MSPPSRSTEMGDGSLAALALTPPQELQSLTALVGGAAPKDHPPPGLPWLSTTLLLALEEEERGSGRFEPASCLKEEEGRKFPLAGASSITLFLSVRVWVGLAACAGS